ncbi:hypothetical protein GYMLUDRAFT_240396 [Collybiopsis luxurians FD-317 M1]|nr:hypothetical protein GYMLUDRAFT_240396 [Collybiopsis luxurians FD-317 M1]
MVPEPAESSLPPPIPDCEPPTDDLNQFGYKEEAEKEDEEEEYEEDEWEDAWFKDEELEE